MDQPVGLLVAFLALVAVLFGLFAGASALVPRLVWLAQRAAEESPGRSLLIGVVNTVFVLAISMTFLANRGPILTFLGGLIAAAGMAALAIGLAGVVTMVGKRLTRQATGLGEIFAGTLVLTLASAAPFLGWFVVLPALVFLGLGGFILGWFRRRAWSAEV
jgi:hypothetical protein